ncbi:unnamed protein product [Peronospora destructor]|uniref:Sodium/calcium exchanger membrane region domain-containing protein n=1 Tax=Peronospora destructor TaxID=86335 RepID=A0AAV0TD64_9STRA|nr:unnamed protein product [Peronospora destructor]
MTSLASMSLPVACNTSPFVANMTLGPLGIDYVHIHYCLLPGSLPFLSFSLLCLWLAALFYFLGSTADGYFSPTLASLSDLLRVPHDVAGVTFLAFGNGAPDVFSAIAAYNSDMGNTGINELLGGAMFISTVVVGGVAVASRVEVRRWAFLRDMGAFISSLLLFLLLSISKNDGDIREDGGVGFHVVGNLAGKPSLIIAAFWHALSPRGNDAKRLARKYGFITRSEVGADVESIADKTGTGKTLEHKEFEMSSPRELASLRFSSRVYDDHFNVEEEDSLSSPLIADSKRDTDNNDEQLLPNWQQHMRWRWRLKRRVIRIFTSDEPLVLKVLCVPQATLVLLRDITVPLLDDESWSRPKACLSPISVPLLVVTISGYTNVDISGSRLSYHVPLWQALAVVGACTSAILSFTTHRSHAPRSLKSSCLLLSLAFVACVSWIYAVANELMALLAAVGYITHASNSLLGLTVLAWGNSVGDLITDVSVARAGFPQMAIAGCFGGLVFNILLGLGLPMVFAFVSGRSEDLPLDAHAWISVVFLLVSLTSTLLVFVHYKYSCPAWYGKLLMIYYCFYSLLNLIVALGVTPT